MEDVKLTITNFPLFHGLDPKFVDLLAENAKNMQFDPGEYIFRESDAAGEFYIITHGKVALELFVAGRGNLMIQTIGKNETLGWSWLTPPFMKNFSARSIETTNAIVFDGDRIRAKCDENHEFGYELIKRFMQVVGQRLQATRLLLLNFYWKREEI